MPLVRTQYAIGIIYLTFESLCFATEFLYIIITIYYLRTENLFPRLFHIYSFSLAGIENITQKWQKSCMFFLLPFLIFPNSLLFCLFLYYIITRTRFRSDKGEKKLI